MGEHSSRATNEEIAVDCKLQVAHLLLRSRCLLEPRRSRPVRLPHQSPDLPLLRPGTQPHSCPWPHCSVRSVRNARSRPHTVLPPRIETWSQVEGDSIEALLLVSELRPDIYGHPEHAAGWSAAGMGIH